MLWTFAVRAIFARRHPRSAGVRHFRFALAARATPTLKLLKQPVPDDLEHSSIIDNLLELEKPSPTLPCGEGHGRCREVRSPIKSPVHDAIMRDLDRQLAFVAIEATTATTAITSLMAIAIINIAFAIAAIATIATAGSGRVVASGPACRGVPFRMAR